MKVAVIMGSDSDWKIMKDACDVLDQFNIEYEKKVVSAHRTPELMMEFSKNAHLDGFAIIIAGAGGAAHLPGMVASHTILPVIGVPISLKNLEGIDSLLSIAQMPKGVPVACMAIDNAYNAGLYAARILSLNSEVLVEKLKSFKEEKKIESLNKTLG